MPDDFSPVFAKVADIMERAIQLNFTMGGRLPAVGYFDDVRGGIPWMPLKPPRSGTPLIATGRFYHSIDSNFGDDFAQVSAGGGMAWDARVPFVHQYGSRDGRIPARPYMILTEHDMDEIEEIIRGDFFITK